MQKLLDALPSNLVVLFFVAGGLLVGITGYLAYMSRAASYLVDDPAACVNCHIMAPYYQSWSKSSHAQRASCNDCHVPNDSMLSAYSFKAQDGLYHAAVFTARAEPQVIRPREASYTVIMENCIRCHTQLNTEFVKTGMISYTQAKNGMGRACWDCHTQVPHTSVSNLAASPGAVVPLPKSPVPAWLRDLL